MSEYVLRLIALEGVAYHGVTLPDQGAFLCTYDVEANDGRGDATFTHDIAKAMKFASWDAALQCWKQQSKRRPLRADGKPNRPLTAFTVSPERLP